MKRLHTFALGALLAAGSLASPLAAAHAAVKHSLPAAGAVLDQAPKQIELAFNERVEQAFSSIGLHEGSTTQPGKQPGKQLSTGKAYVDPADPRLLKLELPALASGAYSVRWVAVGPDGHRRTGEFGFSVK